MKTLPITLPPITEKILQTLNSWQWGEVIAVCGKKCSGASSRSSVYNSNFIYGLLISDTFSKALSAEYCEYLCQNWRTLLAVTVTYIHLTLPLFQPKQRAASTRSCTQCPTPSSGTPWLRISLALASERSPEKQQRRQFKKPQKLAECWIQIFIWTDRLL